MLGLSAFKGVEDIAAGLKGGEKMSLGVHNSLRQIANVSGYSTPAAWGAGLGAAYGGFDGMTSYDGSIIGGAFHGAMLGAAGGAGLKFAADSYAVGASKGFNVKTKGGEQLLRGMNGSEGAWSHFGSGLTDEKGKAFRSFQWGYF
jgi:hypothetical protein